MDNPDHILCLGLSHHTAGLSLRERLAFTAVEAQAALARPGGAADSIKELVLLSTCHRVELYAAATGRDFQALERFLSEARGVPVEAFSDCLYRYTGEAAIDHLFRVAAGLDSLVLGEPQILGQVTEALELARGQGAAGPLLTRLFHAALHAGRRARAETGISHNPASISSVALALAGQVVPDFSSAQVGILGAGEMAELAVEAARKRGAKRVTVVNRTRERALALAQRWGGEAAGFDELNQVLVKVDLLITSTGAPHTVIHTEMLAPLLPERRGRPLAIIDIAVPRDVDVEIGGLPGVRLFDIDMLRAHLEHSLAAREAEAPKVEAILAEEKDLFLGYLRTLDVLPLIAGIREQAEAIRQAELERTLRRLPDLTPEERERLEAMTQALVKKLLHSPIARLRQEAGSPQAAHYVSAARGLFGLE